MPARFSALVIVAALSGLRWGELAALRRCDVDLDAATVRVPRKLAALKDRLEFGPPKSPAGVRVVALPAAAVEALREHLAEYVQDDPEALIFTGAKGAPLRSGNFGRAVKWTTTVAAVGLAGFHFHDLRHTGNTLAASAGCRPNLPLLAAVDLCLGHGSGMTFGWPGRCRPEVASRPGRAGAACIVGHLQPSSSLVH